MGKFVIAVALFAFACVSEAANAPCPGCPAEQDKSRYAEVLPKLQAALATTNADITVVEILSYKTQVVAGTKHIVTYKEKNGQRCSATWVDQPWVSPAPQYVENKCSKP